MMAFMVASILMGLMVSMVMIHYFMALMVQVSMGHMAIGQVSILLTDMAMVMVMVMATE